MSYVWDIIVNTGHINTFGEAEVDLVNLSQCSIALNLSCTQHQLYQKLKNCGDLNLYMSALSINNKEISPRRFDISAGPTTEELIKTRQLLIFANHYNYAHIWKGPKGEAVGGSEMAIVLGRNPYNTTSQNLVDLKSSQTNFPARGKATRWGNLFEPVLFYNVEKIAFGCSLTSRVNVLEWETSKTEPKHESRKKLYSIRALPGIKDETGKVIVRYTPDRLAVLSKTEIGLLTNRTENIFPHLGEYICVLFEGKCPITRIPKRTIPDYYLDQPLTGMCTIPISEASLYVDGMFRRCSYDKLNFSSEYDTTFHDGKVIRDTPVAIGYLGFYREGRMSNGVPNYIDFGMVTVGTFEQLLADVVDNMNTGIRNVKVYIAESCDRGEFERFCLNNKHEIVGILPWKLMILEVIPINKDYEYLERNYNKIYDFVKAVKDKKEA